MRFYVFLTLFQLFLKVSCSSDSYCNFTEGAFLIVYTCHNYRYLPQNLPRAGEALVLQMSKNSNTLETLKQGALLNTGMHNLTKLYLNNCRVQKIELGAFKGGTQLSLLGLNSNRIEVLNFKVFEDLPNLEVLKLEGNPLKSFGTQEFPKMNLKDLHLSNCGLTELGENLFQNLLKLEKLHLQENNFKKVSWKVFGKLKRLFVVVIHGNPWHFDCQVKFLLDYLHSDHVIWDVPTAIPECSTAFSGGGGELVGVKWSKLNTELLVCPPKIEMLYYSKSEAVNGPLKLHCYYSGYPEPKVSWKKNGKAVNDAIVAKEVLDRDGFKNFNFKETLIFPSAKTGIYQCNTESKAGSEAVSMRVELSGGKGISEVTATFPPSLPPPMTHNGLIQQSTTSFKTSSEQGGSDTRFWLGLVIGILIVVGVVLVIVGVAVYYLIKLVNKRHLPKEIYKEVPRPSAPEEPRYYAIPPSAGGAQHNLNEQNIYETLDSPRTPKEPYYLTPISLPQPLIPLRGSSRDTIVVFHNQKASSEFNLLI